jgi:acyl dehydratase
MWCSYHARTSRYRGRGPTAIAHGFGAAAVCFGVLASWRFGPSALSWDDSPLEPV